MQRGLVGSEMCIRDSINAEYMGTFILNTLCYGLGIILILVFLGLWTMFFAKMCRRVCACAIPGKRYSRVPILQLMNLEDTSGMIRFFQIPIGGCCGKSAYEAQIGDVEVDEKFLVTVAAALVVIFVEDL
eukprot:TRINITY_DN28803_c0_g1_i1.p2 TRINITY_DN28803_c0_g1~~TRINITY_DN28803_c0_g1_i1.p2  ORF type:complete len:130 (+),score=18.02 TRINITY_DN28803_c0_g1_i1:112-501(+)